MIGKIEMISDDKIGIYITFDEPCIFKFNQPVYVGGRHAKRSNQQNKLYWCFLQYCIENGLKEHGHFSADALHEDIKLYMHDKYPNQYTMDFSTSDMNVLQYSEYFQIVEREIMNQFFCINTSKFIENYDLWKSYNNGETFKDFLTNK